MGRKIKTFSKVIMILFISACLIAAAYILISCYDRNGGFYHLQHATINGGNPHSDWVGANWEAQGNDIYFSIQLAIYFGLGAAGCLLWGLPLYWFGCMFQRVEQIQLELDGIRKEQAAKLN